jgi:hypothetical protein
VVVAGVVVVAVPDCPGPPPPRRPKRAGSSDAHFFDAAVNCGLVVFSFDVLNTGPVPLVFGAGSVIPFVFMHAANFTSAACCVAF